MGSHNFVVNDAPTNTRRVYPFRWLARLVCRLRARKDGNHDITEHACKGPSILHNLLPILEPFLLFQPKLLYLEDRILGRERAPRTDDSYEVPSSLDELKSWSKDATKPCDCDKCAPWLYQLDSKSSHGVISRQRHDVKQRSHGFQARHGLPNPQPDLRLRLYGDYEAMRLVRHHIDWLDNTYLHRPTKDNINVQQLKSLLQVWNPHLTGQDMGVSMSHAQHLSLMSLLNKIFFFNAIPSHRNAVSNGFSYLPVTQQSCFGIGTFNPLIGTQLLLHPTLYRHHGDPSDLDIRWRSRLGTILHELSHAYLKAYTCRSCPMHDTCVGERGHGRAWQLLAAKIEEVATRLLDGFVDMGRYQSLLHDFEGHGRVPSGHDLEVLRFGTGWSHV
jgi:hypothetical protein